MYRINGQLMKYEITKEKKQHSKLFHLHCYMVNKTNALLKCQFGGEKNAETTCAKNFISNWWRKSGKFSSFFSLFHTFATIWLTKVSQMAQRNKKKINMINGWNMARQGKAMYRVLSVAMNDHPHPSSSSASDRYIFYALTHTRTHHINSYSDSPILRAHWHIRSIVCSTLIISLIFHSINSIDVF